MTDEFKDYAKQVVENSKVFAERFMELGWKVISNRTENHMFVLDVYNSVGITGKQAEELLDTINITVNKNQIPNDTLPPLQSSGIRIGTPAMTTKGFSEAEFIKLADIMDGALRMYANDYKLYGEVAQEDVFANYINEVNNLVKGVINNE